MPRVSTPMKIIKIAAGLIALLPCIVIYAASYFFSSMANAAKEGWRDGS